MSTRGFLPDERDDVDIALGFERVAIVDLEEGAAFARHFALSEALSAVGDDVEGLR